MNKEDLELSKLLGSGSSFILIGFIGILIPIIGWIFGGLAAGKANTVLNYIESQPNLRKKYWGRAKSVQSSSGAILMLSTVSVIVWVIVLISQH